MTVSYVIPGINRNNVLKAAIDIGLRVEDKGNTYRLTLEIDPKYSLRKRMKLANMANIPADDVQHGDESSSIFIDKTPDTENCWFVGSAVSITHPEVILDKLAEALDSYWLSEHDPEYAQIAGYEDDEELE